MTPLTLCELKVGILVDGQLISLFSMVETYIERTCTLCMAQVFKA
ncbi:hypothetical protein ACK3ZF_10815 [Aeromonas caviae]